MEIRCHASASHALCEKGLAGTQLGTEASLLLLVVLALSVSWHQGQRVLHKKPWKYSGPHVPSASL